ncbi:MAG: hypothetical protein ACTS78_04625 [Arsenophonus sp. NC-WZS1-MAG3]
MPVFFSIFQASSSLQDDTSLKNLPTKSIKDFLAALQFSAS